MKITKNFTLEEMTASETAEKYKIDNTPDEESVQNIIYLVENVLQPVRDKWGGPIHVNSCFRCEELNRKVGGANNSSHKYGAAADISVGKPEDNRKLFMLIKTMIDRHEITVRSLLDEYDYRWIHLDINCEHTSYKENHVGHLK